ncbi:hypothetical protein [Parabacteroides sp.]
MTGEDCPPFPLHITGGTLTADYIGAPATESNAQPVTISGGSIRCKELRGPVSEDGKDLLLTIVTLPAIEPRAARATDGGEEIPVTRYSGLDGYSLDNAYADSDGRLYLWLPEGTTYPDVRINNGVGTVTAGQDVTLALEEIIPDITYYAVTIPAVEGLSTTPAPGTYSYEEGDNLRLTLELAPAYAQSTPVVKAYGQPVSPNRDGSYTIPVYADLEILIEGVRPDTPVSNADVTPSESRAYALRGTIHIEAAAPLSAEVVTTGGKVIRHLDLPAGVTRLYGLPEGFYIVRLSDGTTAKVALTR